MHFVSSDLEDGTAGGVDLVFVVAAAGFKFHIVYQPAVVLVQADLQIPHIGQGQPGVGQGNIPGLVGGEGSGGAAGGVGCKYLARPESEVLLLVGTGAQGPVLLEATLKVMHHIKRILISNPHSPHKVAGFITNIRRIISNDIHVQAADDLEQAVRAADIILTATPSRAALIQRDWVKPGTHLSCIGSDMEGKQELDERLLAQGKVFCDDLTQAITVGECEKAIKQGLFSPDRIIEIGDVILGRKPGREQKDEITIFDSSGIGLQDLMVASQVTDLARSKKLGIEMKL